MELMNTTVLTSPITVNHLLTTIVVPTEKSGARPKDNAKIHLFHAVIQAF